MEKYKFQNQSPKNSHTCVPLRNPYKNLKSENSQDYAQKPRRNCTFMNKASNTEKGKF